MSKYALIILLTHMCVWSLSLHAEDAKVESMENHQPQQLMAPTIRGQHFSLPRSGYLDPQSPISCPPYCGGDRNYQEAVPPPWAYGVIPHPMYAPYAY